MKKPLNESSKKSIKSKKRIVSDFDVLGSWTGNYLAGVLEDPVQDVDDL